MAVYERSTVVGAPLEEVWAFHTTPASLAAVTLGWFNLAVESVVGPDGTPADAFTEGTEVTLSVRPFGVGSRRRWTSRITAVEHAHGQSLFRDRMLDGPFPRWHHTHRFAAVPDGTRLTDRVEYALPLGPARSLSGLAWPGFEAVFAARHRATRRRFE